MFTKPEHSPWGKVQICDTLCPRVFMVSTASPGGTMVSNDMTAFLSPAAKKCGMRYSNYLCFEEDCQENIVFRELLDKKMWAIPGRIKDKPAFEKHINDSLREYNPGYWRTRQAGLQKQPARQAVSAQTHAQPNI